MTYNTRIQVSNQAMPSKLPDTNSNYDNGGESPLKNSTLISRNLSILGHRTSVRLEPEMWAALKDIAKRENTSIHLICSLVALRKVPESTLTAAIRVFLLLYYRAATSEECHLNVGHGNFEIMKRRARVTDDALRGSRVN